MELRGADFDWGNWAGLPPDQLARCRAAAAALLQDPAAATRRPCLDWQRLTRQQAQKPKGDAGSGKASPAAARLGGTAGDDNSALSPGAGASFGAPDTRLALGDAPETANGVQQIVVTLPDLASEDADAHARQALTLSQICWLRVPASAPVVAPCQGGKAHAHLLGCAADAL